MTLQLTLLNVLLQHFAVCTVDYGRQPPSKNREVEQSAQLLIEAKGVFKQLQSLDRSKGAGPYGLSSALPKFLANCIYQPLTTIYQYSIDTSLIPNDWKRAHVIPIHKIDSLFDSMNYRPISMSCIASKILQHVICDMNNFLDAHHLLSDCQHCFRNKHGCDTQLYSTTSDLIDFNGLNIHVDLAVLDFSTFRNWLQNLGRLVSTSQLAGGYLSGFPVEHFGRYEQHKVLTTQSHFGAPQGSVLGPLLF